MTSTTGAPRPSAPRSQASRAKAPSPAADAGPISPATREAMIQMVAYRFYERRGFVGGSELQDWLEAEMEVDRQLAASAASAVQPAAKRPAARTTKAAKATRQR